MRKRSTIPELLLLLAGCLPLLACDSAGISSPSNVPNRSTVRVVSVTGFTGSEARDSLIAQLERIVADPVLLSMSTASDAGGIPALLNQLKATNRAEPSSASNFPISYDMGHWVTGSSYIVRYTTSGDSRVVDYKSYTGCSGYSSMVNAGGVSTIRQTASNGTVTFSGEYAMPSGFTYSQGDVNTQVNGDPQYGTISTRHTCRETWYSMTDLFYSSSGSTV